ncbi:MAG: bifunctional glycosyltransferase family 2/GtrA family protein [Clostridia bacterium]|nr:bifunctional glycosyltransferase family 2/GtrA family protein [Clostridia bacterium]
MGRDRITVIIPAYKPDRSLISTIVSLRGSGFSEFIVVDDGSGEEFEGIFGEVSSLPGCRLLRHEVNMGKGAAIKTAVRCFTEEYADSPGFVTVDADGQHLPEDVSKTADEMEKTGSVVLGCRDFSGPDVPARSRFGNRFTCAVFRIFFGARVSDTQTGLRAFPAKYAKTLLEVKGSRYEYETNMLIDIVSASIPLTEVFITTVYEDGNSSSHFRPVRDSIRVYSRIIKYILSSMSSALADGFVFWLVKHITVLGEIIPVPLTFTASVIARIISSLLNYLINSNVVFSKKTSARSLIKYYILAAVQLCVSAAAVFALENLFGVSAPILSTLIKIIVDILLWFISFRIQHRWVFAEKGGNND